MCSDNGVGNAQSCAKAQQLTQKCYWRAGGFWGWMVGVSSGGRRGGGRVGAARDKVRLCHLWCNAEGNRIDTLPNKSSGRLLNLCATTVDRIRWVTLEAALCCSTKPGKWLSGWNVCRRHNMPHWCCCFYFCAQSIAVSLASTEVREHLLSLFIPFSGRRARRRERDWDTTETEHKEKQAAAIRLQPEAWGEERTRLQYRLYIFATKRFRKPEPAYYVHMLLSLQAKLEMQIRKWMYVHA